MLQKQKWHLTLQRWVTHYSMVEDFYLVSISDHYAYSNKKTIDFWY